MSAIIVHTTGPAYGTSLVMARRCGYMDAIDAMLERASDYRDLQVRKALLDVVRELKTTKV